MLSSNLYKITGLLILQIISQAFSETCTLPDGKTSECVRLHHCESLNDLLKSFSGKPPSSVINTVYVYNNLCPAKSRTVCCPNSEDLKTTTTFSTNVTESTQTTPVTLTVTTKKPEVSKSTLEEEITTLEPVSETTVIEIISETESYVEELTTESAQVIEKVL